MALLTYRCNFKLSHAFTICNLFSFPVPKLQKQITKPKDPILKKMTGEGGNTSRVRLCLLATWCSAWRQLFTLSFANPLPPLQHMYLVKTQIASKNIQNTLVFLVAHKFKKNTLDMFLKLWWFRCDTCLQNPKLWPTHSLTDRGRGYCIFKK